MGKDHEILGVPEGAEQREIKKAYFKLVRQFSPEKDPEKFQEIRGAYERLMQGDGQKEGEFQLSLEMPDDLFAHRMFQQMTMLRQQGDYDGAAATAQEAMMYFGEHEAFLFELAANQLHGGHSGNAAKNFEKLVKQYPEKMAYKRELAIAYYERGYGKKAFEAFEKAYATGVRDTDFVLQFSLCCRDREEEDRGIEILLEMVKGYDAAAKADVQDYVEAYTGLFTLEYLVPSEKLGETLHLYCDFLKAAGRALRDESDLLMDMTFFLVKAFNKPEYLDKLEEVLAATKKILPTKAYADVWEEISSSMLGTRIRMDERLDSQWFGCYQAYFEAYSIHGDGTVTRFIQMDATLILLERIEEIRPQFEIVRKEYPKLYERMKDVYSALEQNNLSYFMEKMRKNYSLLYKSIEGGLYYEFYPQYKVQEDTVQWDSSESGSYVRMGRKIGRNDPCPCGSGKKYKKCCGK